MLWQWRLQGCAEVTEQHGSGAGSSTALGGGEGRRAAVMGIVGLVLRRPRGL